MNWEPDDAKAIEEIIRLLSAAWTTDILLQLETGTKRTSELLNALRPLSAKILAARLRTLGECEMVTRVSYSEVPPRVEYTLTERGKHAIQLLHTVNQVVNKQAN